MSDDFQKIMHEHICDWGNNPYDLIEVDDKYKLFFKECEIKLRDTDCKIAKDERYQKYSDEQVLYEDINLKGVEYINYTFWNYYRTVIFSVKVDENDDNHIWKPGDNFVPTTPISKSDFSGRPFYGPGCFVNDRMYMSKDGQRFNEGFFIQQRSGTMVGNYKKDDKRFIFGDFDEFYLASTHYIFQDSVSLEVLAKMDSIDDMYYTSLQTVRNARELYELFFPKWSLY